MNATCEALFFEQQGDAVRCGLCAHHCLIGEGKRGICGVRENREGRLVSLVYGNLVAEHVDPIEKKPLFHVLPGSLSYSIATMGCNFRCLHCQNSSISQVDSRSGDLPGVTRTPESVVRAAQRSQCQSISYTYVEPTIFFEFAYRCSVLAAQQGLKNIFVSNGYMSRGAVEMLAPVLCAVNVDIKAFSDQFYKKVCGARLQPVLDTVELLHALGVWVEVTTLIIPGMNDSPAELASIASFLAAIDRNIPWHVTAFYPSHRMLDVPPTPRSSLKAAARIGRDKGLLHVYEGNIGVGGEDTVCGSCGSRLIERRGLQVLSNRLTGGACPDCGAHLAGVWD
ncbi:AmmeMemoRadiSam system radical SAM enzyme [Desulfoprunum benzoelyticum]|uniref:Pyruvate formate lyase activating enzyme n=1 Tax=Desulfoprunum benzoelyticum TaxID=1506996 RepID=A0A840V1D0_9BACT|nr:AmmeMemoRadiSam system radical SAM enzyme [Desulfoprunum benzoelyticum]MBB5347640.1 pyruvate formate lyase activating enzyme [Desulfoprunum benzoelyticum]MBM9529232.1 AmmeMemoRadiSam system radical SAM enzyme [Desulfoprunum benzoelyticum]